MTLKPYETAILLQMYDERIIGPSGYASIQTVRGKINWKRISSHYRVKGSFESIARGLVKRKLLFDDGKSMAVLLLAKLGVSFVVGYLKENPDAFKDLEEIINNASFRGGQIRDFFYRIFDKFNCWRVSLATGQFFVE